VFGLSIQVKKKIGDLIRAKLEKPGGEKI